jgi:polyhydroxyalkanoate synthesis regulator phasin
MTYTTHRTLLAVAVAVVAGVGCSRNKPKTDLTPPAGGDASAASGAIQVTRQAIQTRRDAIVAQAMPLTEAQGQKFWPLYREYRSEVQKLNDRTVNILAYSTRVGGQFTDQEAKDLLDEYLKIQKDKVDVQENYVDKFRDVLPQVQVARLFQLENKLDAVVAYDLAGAVPLAQKLEP